MPNSILIIGPGLIGGSLGLSLHDSPGIKKIMGCDTNKDTLKKALQIGAIDEAVSLQQGVQQADIIFICTPLRFYQSLLREIKSDLKAGTIISDTGSTKVEVMKAFQEELPSEVWAIGGHPMAGSETKGIDGADRYLFENAVHVLTPADNTPQSVIDILVDILKPGGARFKIMDAAKHDQLVASISHIPHLAAASLVNLTKADPDTLMLAAGGFRDTTRIASSNPELWEDILFSNRDAVIDKLDDLINELISVKKSLQLQDHQTLVDKLSFARETRNKIPRIRKGLLPAFHDIVCIVPDKPGIIGQLASILGKENINIVDIEVLRAREGDGGTIRLGIPSLEDACQAVELLQANSIKSWIR